MWPLGRPLAVLAVLAVGAGFWLAAEPRREAAAMQVWTFAPTNADVFREPGLHDAAYNVELMHVRALDTRLTALALADAEMPAVVELEINSAAKHVPSGHLLPLTDRLRSAGLLDRLPPALLAPWSDKDEVYAVPQAVHPVTLTYRADLFAEAGLDPAAWRTWDQLAEGLRRYRAYHGKPALELPAAQPSHLSMMLLQRGISPTQAANDPRAEAVIAFYTTLLDDGVAVDASGGPVGWVDDLAVGDLAMAFTPDWRVKYLDDRSAELAGKLRMMPLPVFGPGDARTSVWGGTALAIPANAADPDAAWALLRSLSFGDTALSARRKHTHILPADAATWPAFDEPHPLFGGQSVGGLYAELAAEVPERVVNADTPKASAALVERLRKARGNDGTP